MTARYKKRHRSQIPRRRSTVVFETVTLDDLKRWAAWGEEGRRFHWKWYSDLTYQRAQIADKLRAALAGAAEPFAFQNWQRVGRYKYALHPLSIRGSLQFAGRFNIVKLDLVRFPPFPALYLASDRETALQEVLGQDASTQGKLTPYETALAKSDAIFSVPIRGNVRIINLGKPEKLEAFVDLIKDFPIDRDLIRMARLNSMPEPNLIRTTAQLISALAITLAAGSRLCH